MSNYEYIDITNIDTFNEENILFHPDMVWKKDEKASWSKIYFKYKYPSGKIEPLRVQLGELFSFGITSFENDTNKTYSFSFVMYSKEEREKIKNNELVDDATLQKIEKEDKIINLFQTIEQTIKNNLNSASLQAKIGKNRNWTKYINDIELLKIKDKHLETTNPPALFCKVMTGTANFTQFHKIKNNKIIAVDQNDIIPKLLDKRNKCNAFGCVMFESVYVAAAKPSVQMKLVNVCITKLISQNMHELVVPACVALRHNIDILNDDSESENEEVLNIPL
jgi:hypothetical protein